MKLVLIAKVRRKAAVVEDIVNGLREFGCTITKKENSYSDVFIITGLTVQMLKMTLKYGTIFDWESQGDDLFPNSEGNYYIVDKEEEHWGVFEPDEEIEDKWYLEFS